MKGIEMVKKDPMMMDEDLLTDEVGEEDDVEEPQDDEVQTPAPTPAPPLVRQSNVNTPPKRPSLIHA